MHITTGAEAIGQYGWTHWTDEPVTPDGHKLALIPQTMIDCWQGFCSCGEWRATPASREFDKVGDEFAELRAAHAAHASGG